MRKILLLLLIIVGCKLNLIKLIEKKNEIKIEQKEITKKEFYNSYIRNDLIIESVFLCSERFQIEPELIISIMYYESRFDEKATNDKNPNGSIDRGLMQLNSFTFSSLTVNEFYDIECNIFNGTKHLKDLLIKYNDNEILSICAYNCGESRVDKENIKMSTIIYANKVLKYKNYLKQEFLKESIKNE